MVESSSVQDSYNLEMQFEKLETRIIEAVTTIQALRADNKVLKEELENAGTKINELEQTVVNVQEHLTEAEKWQDQVKELSRVKEKTAGKIQALISRIDSIPL